MASEQCQRCQSTKLMSFEPDRTVAARVAGMTLPVVCRDCGLITINGQAVGFPPAFEQQAMSMANAAATAGEETARRLAEDPNPQVATYFARVYRNAYLDGFWRAYAFWKHTAKEGRLVRLRDLWKRRCVRLDYSDGPMVLEMDKTVYAEFSRLLELGNDGTRPENQDPPVPAGQARLPE